MAYNAYMNNNFDYFANKINDMDVKTILNMK